ncbi:MAG: glycosyltransferase family 4 protein [Candidatus Jordarchaeum sp.]|uniref:glycosyltransferase family 4 protein n=1 Tax=Candidatus Jordarchaeum sp. TaxID=2823881 RepID=UPI00404A8C80
METLKIGFFCWESLYSVRIGGLAMAATNLAESLAKEHEVHYFSPGLKTQKKSTEKQGVYYHRCHPSGPNIIEYCKNMSLQMVEDYLAEEKNGAFDALHFHDWHPTEALHLLQDRPTVLTFHSTEYGRNGNQFGGWWEYKEISGKEWYAALICKKITTISQALRKEAMWLYNIPEWKIKVVPNGIEPEKFHMDINAEEVKKDYVVNPEEPLVFYMGRLVYQKGPDLLLHAAPKILERHPNAKFLFAGNGDMRPFLEGWAKSFDGHVRFLGYLPDKEFVRLLNAVDLVVIPSRNEPFGLVLLEAWSAKKGVVATDVGGLSENIDNFENGVKVYVTPESIAWGANYCLNDLESTRNMGKKGWEKLGKFRWETIAKEMVGVYRNVSDTSEIHTI